MKIIDLSQGHRSLIWGYHLSHLVVGELAGTPSKWDLDYSVKHKGLMSAMVEAQTKKKGLTTSSSLGNTLLQRKSQHWMLHAIGPGSFSGKHERMLPQICGKMDVPLNSSHCRSWPLEGDREWGSAKPQVSRTWLWSLFHSGGMMQRSWVVCPNLTQ